MTTISIYTLENKELLQEEVTRLVNQAKNGTEKEKTDAIDTLAATLLETQTLWLDMLDAYDAALVNPAQTEMSRPATPYDVYPYA